LLAAVIVSAIANVSEGFAVAQGVKLTVESVKRLDIVQATIGLTSTALISLLVLVLGEVVGTDVNIAVKAQQKAQRKALKITNILKRVPWRKFREYIIFFHQISWNELN
jgi:hypothetical protein